MDTRQVVARFEAERQALAIMDHPNIAKVLDGGQTSSGRPYFVMDLVKGLPITEYCDQAQLTPRERLELFVQVCQAVQHAHQKGVIHRDLKPSNVLVMVQDTTPVVKVIDFGVAKALGHELTEKTLFTGFAQMVGTPIYMSPEQAGQSGVDIDTRSDIYSLGVLLYELLTGTTPFEKERLKELGYDELRRIIREEEPPRPSTRISTLGQAATRVSTQRKSDSKRLSRLFRGELDWIVMKCLEKDRSRRYETASAFAADVQRYLNNETVQACPPSKWYRFRKFARRHKAALATATVMAAAVLIAIVSLISAVTVLAESNVEVKQEQEQTKKALKGQKEANENLRKAVAREERSLAFQRIALAARELEADNVGRAEELLTECPEKLRGWEWHYLKRFPHDKPRVLYAAEAQPFWGLAYSTDGRYLAIGSSSEVKLLEPATGKVLEILRGHAGPVAFSPKGGQLALRGPGNEIILWDMAARKKTSTLRGAGWVITLAYRPDGQMLATAGITGEVMVWNTATGEKALSFPVHTGMASGVAFSPDGRLLASCGFDFQVRVWDVATGQQHRRLAGHRAYVSSVVFHPDGRHLVSAGSDGLRIWDVQTGEEELALGINSSATCAVFSPDGSRLVAAGWDKIVKVWDWPTGQEVLSLRGHTQMLAALAFSADGQRLVSASLDGTLRLWNATPLADDEPGYGRKLRGHTGPVLALAFSPDNRYLVTAGEDRTAKLWEVPAGKLLHTLPGHDGMVTSAAFHAAGKLLTTVTADGTIVQWDPASGQRRQTLARHLGPLLSHGFKVTFRRDGEQFATLGKEGTRVFETASGRQVANPLTASMMSTFLSPDGKHLAAANTLLKSVQLHEVESGKKVADLMGVSQIILDLAFGGDGQRVAAAVWDGSVTVWDVKSKKILHTFRHSDRVTCVAFHPNGRQLASGSCDNTAKIWDLETGKEIETLRGHIGYVMSLAYSPDGNLLASASGNRYQGEVQLWETAAFGKKR
jgi:WD40 repeat protein